MPNNSEERDCGKCIFHASGRCSKWNCEFISVKEAEEAFKKINAKEVLQENE
jgi:hypothetical protein